MEKKTKLFQIVASEGKWNNTVHELENSGHQRYHGHGLHSLHHISLFFRADTSIYENSVLTENKHQ